MSEQNRDIQEHEKLRSLCALASSGTLTPGELAELKAHVASCDECREAVSEYGDLIRSAMPMLAARYGSAEEVGDWDDSKVGERIFARIALKETHNGGARSTAGAMTRVGF